MQIYITRSNIVKLSFVSLIILILVSALLLCACGKEDAENTSSTNATSQILQSMQSSTDNIIVNAEPIPLSEGEIMVSSSAFKGRVHLGGSERECFMRSAVILNEKLPFGAVMYFDVLDENGDILVFRKCSGYGFVAADMSEETPSKFLFYSVMALENGMFEAKTELIFFDDRDRLTAESTGTLSAYHQGSSYSFKGDANDDVSMAGCADSFTVLADKTLEFLNGGDFEVISQSISSDEDPINFVKELDVETFKAMYERTYNK